MQSHELSALGLTNYGHFTTMRVIDGHVRGLALHLERLENDCRALFGAELDVEQVRDRCRRELAGIGEAVIRVTVFDPELPLGRPGGESKPELLVTVRSAVSLPAPPLRVMAVPYRRDVPLVKHVGLFGTVHLRRRAQLDGFDDVLFTERAHRAGRAGRVTEGATWNVGFVRGGSVIWPLGDVLPGVTMRLLQETGSHETLAVEVSELSAFEAAFATNANVGVQTIRAIDDHTYPVTHPLVDDLRAAYSAIPLEPL